MTPLSNSKPKDAISANGKTAIGLNNVRKRLELLYPDGHFLTMGLIENIFNVNMQIPLQKLRQSHRKPERLYKGCYKRQNCRYKSNPISSPEESLPKNFIRINRSFIVSVNKIESYTNKLIQIGKYEFPISRSYRHEVEKQYIKACKKCFCKT